MATEESPAQDQTDIFRQLASYSWDRDHEFQGGLSAILGNTESPSQIQELTLRAQCFYFSRKMLNRAPIDFDGYKSYLSTHGHSPPTSDPPQTTSDVPAQARTPSHHAADLPPASTSTAEPKSAPYPQTFSQIVALITSGAPIPGIKEIPPTLLTDQATKPTASKRRKPWEKENAEVSNEGTFGDRRDEIIQQEVPDS